MSGEPDSGCDNYTTGTCITHGCTTPCDQCRGVIGEQLDLDEIMEHHGKYATEQDCGPCFWDNPHHCTTIALVAEMRRLRTDRDALRSVASGHIFDPENYISPLRPQIRALRDAILGETDGELSR